MVLLRSLCSPSSAFFRRCQAFSKRLRSRKSQAREGPARGRCFSWRDRGRAPQRAGHSSDFLLTHCRFHTILSMARPPARPFHAPGDEIGPVAGSARLKPRGESPRRLPGKSPGGGSQKRAPSGSPRRRAPVEEPSRRARHEPFPGTKAGNQRLGRRTSGRDPRGRLRSSGLRGRDPGRSRGTAAPERRLRGRGS